jgi:uncharacterized damage-inducible protein DinB
MVGARLDGMVTELPAAKASGGDEQSVLRGYLAYHRAVLARKVDGLTDEQARRSACPPSTLTLLGLIRHLADVERHWFRRGLGEEIPPIFEDDEEWRLPPDATLVDAVAVYWDEIAAADRNLDGASLDDPMPGDDDPKYTVRRTIVHMIEEYARHCGHADLLREAIDGATGD